ncbi:DUF3306 domain-containing protein [Variovorax ginsengisoli]|uniref:DUF3306 domain-containing protein n=1 Tax=Variovorax ginsengisoli TaxID=363844 RepID=A0ABT9S281_9BURK|nr:DUF3306 domain-containing protein [Variovorax ginsengisoli]MDP9897886.1 hypothetical protein [Variovorax ginsengisoli]
MSEGFFDRWSRRKQQAREEPAPPAPSALPVAPAEAASPPPELSPEEEGVTTPSTAGPPPLTLADTESLTIGSDFRPFVAKGVQPEVKNAAFRKLFADPHFNVMDGMDTYIDDYSKPTPIPDSVLRQMASAKFLKLFEEEEGPAPELAPEQAQESDGVPDVAQSDAPGNLPSPLVADAQPASHMTDDPNADLRLQPDDAARAEDARARAG